MSGQPESTIDANSEKFKQVCPMQSVNTDHKCITFGLSFCDNIWLDAFLKDSLRRKELRVCSKSE